MDYLLGGKKVMVPTFVISLQSIRGINQLPVTTRVTMSSNVRMVNDQGLETVLRKGHDTLHLRHVIRTENRVYGRGEDDKLRSGRVCTAP